MSVDYVVRTEILRDGKWSNIDTYTKDGKILNTYECGTSFFNGAYDRIVDRGYGIKKSESFGDEEVIALPVSELIVKGKAHHGYVHKDSIVAFEEGEIEELCEAEFAYDEDEREVKPVVPIERNQAYEYYEWNNPYDWQSYFTEIYKRVQSRLYDYGNYHYKPVEAVRVLVARYY